MPKSQEQFEELYEDPYPANVANAGHREVLREKLEPIILEPAVTAIVGIGNFLSKHKNVAKSLIVTAGALSATAGFAAAKHRSVS